MQQGPCHAQELKSPCIYSASMLKCFYDCVKPYIVAGPVDQDSSHRGSAIELLSIVYSYGWWNRINRVKYEFRVHDAAGTPDAWDNGLWTILDYGEKGSGNLNHTWQLTEDVGSQQINSQWVWIRARAVDDGECDSVPVIGRIKVDSEPPSITIVGQ